MTVSCIICQKEYTTKGIHTHYERSHGDKKQKKNIATVTMANTKSFPIN